MSIGESYLTYAGCTHGLRVDRSCQRRLDVRSTKTGSVVPGRRIPGLSLHVLANMLIPIHVSFYLTRTSFSQLKKKKNPKCQSGDWNPGPAIRAECLISELPPTTGKRTMGVIKLEDGGL